MYIKLIICINSDTGNFILFYYIHFVDYFSSDYFIKKTVKVLIFFHYAFVLYFK